MSDPWSKINDDPDFSEFFNELGNLLGEGTGIQIKGKEMLVQSRLSRRLRVLKLRSFQEYGNYIKENREAETPELISLLTTHKTEFFREAAHFDYLFHHVFPGLIRAKQPIRIWSAGSSTGEEAYSIAITFLEYFRTMSGPEVRLPQFQVIGTDIDVNCIRTAKDGVYPEKSIRSLKPSTVERYFDLGSGELGQWVKIKDEVWKLCEFKVMNMLDASFPLPEFDVVFARNMFIYFLPDMIQRAMQKIHAHLVDNGLLFLGLTEAVNTPNLPFVALGKSTYKKIGDNNRPKLGGDAAKTSLRFDRIRVLIVDDSPTIRKMLTRILSTDSDFSIVGEASNPLEADQILKTKEVDVMTLDIQMPEMDGVTYLRQMIGKTYPPVVMISSISFKEASEGLKCFELGAVDYLEKPSSLDLTTKDEEIRTVLRGAATSRAQLRPIQATAEIIHYQESSDHKEIIAIGASAGGPSAVQAVLRQFPHNAPPTVIVQHLPKLFTEAFAKKLSEHCLVKVVQAVDGEPLEYGHVYIAPGGYQMKVEKKVGKLVIVLKNDAPMSQHCPSVDYLFSSLADLDESYRISAAILTGMGRDGALGMKQLLSKGAYTLAQDEQSCVVFGMPRAAIEGGAVMDVLPLEKIAGALFKGLAKMKKAAAV